MDWHDLELPPEVAKRLEAQNTEGLEAMRSLCMTVLAGFWKRRDDFKVWMVRKALHCLEGTDRAKLLQIQTYCNNHGSASGAKLANGIMDIIGRHA